MTFSYSAGTTTPTYAGLVEIGGIRINDGSFRSQHLVGLMDTPTPRTVVSDLPQDHGAFLGPSYYSARDITLDGWFDTVNPDDVPAAREYLKAVFALTSPTIMSTLVCNWRGWATRRQCAVRIAGPVVFEEPDINQKKVATRNFTIPLVAPDPILYDADNLRTSTLPMDNTVHTLTGSGSMPVPFTARFTGPFTTAASLIDNVSGIEITLSTTLTAGQYVDIDFTTVGDPRATKNDGTDMMGSVTILDLRALQPGTNSWRAAGSSGTTGASGVTVTWRDGWI